MGVNRNIHSSRIWKGAISDNRILKTYRFVLIAK